MGLWYALTTPMKRTLFFALIFFLTAGIASPALALTVSPAKIEVQADPGQTVRGEIEIFNEQTDTKNFFTSYENFESRGDSGAPYFIGAESGLATWITVAPEVKIDSGKRVTVAYTITVPVGTKPGGYFAAIFFGSQPPKVTGGGEVTIGGKIGILILLRVNGEVEESAGLVDFGVKDGKRFFSMLPVTFEYGFNNTGGDRAVPRGEIKIKNTVQLTSATLLANERQGSVLPNSTRRFDILWGDKQNDETMTEGFFATAGRQLKDFHFGWYTAKLNVSWGASSQTAGASYHFFILPWQLLSIVLPILIIAWFMGRIMLKRYKRRIIAEAMQQK